MNFFNKIYIFILALNKAFEKAINEMIKNIKGIIMTKHILVILAFVILTAIAMLVLTFVPIPESDQISSELLDLIVYGSIALTYVLYFLSGIKTVSINQTGFVLTLNSFEKQVHPGPTIVYPGLCRLVTFPSSQISADMQAEEVTITSPTGSDDETPVFVDNTTAFTVYDPITVYLKWGAENIEDLLEKMFGKADENGKRSGALVSDKIADIIRSEFATSAILTLSDALSNKEQLSQTIIRDLEQYFPTNEYGIDWDKNVISDVELPEEIDEAQKKKTISDIQREQAKIEAETEVIKAKGLADAERETGKAAAEVEMMIFLKKLEFYNLIQEKDNHPLKNNPTLVLALFKSEYMKHVTGKAEHLNLLFTDEKDNEEAFHKLFTQHVMNTQTK